MTTLIDIIGLEIVGYRFGIAPENGFSYNTAENCYEPGVSMAQVGYGKEIGSFAADAQSESSRKYYYIGAVAGIGSDGEVCLSDVKSIGRNEYLNLRKTMIEASNKIVAYIADSKEQLINNGWNIGRTIEDIEIYRRQYTK